MPIIYGEDSIVIQCSYLDSTIDRDPKQESRFGTPSRDVVRGGKGAGAEGTLAQLLFPGIWRFRKENKARNRRPICISSLDLKT